MMSMAIGVIDVEWRYLKDFINRYTLISVSKYMEDETQYLLVVPSDGYVFRSVITKTDPKNNVQLEFETMYGIS